MRVTQLSDAIAAGESVRVLDVRTPGEFENQHIPGAYNVPLDQLAEHAPELRAVTGCQVALGSVAALMASPIWALVPAVIGAGLVFAGITDTCGMGMLLAKLPYNRAASCDTVSIVRRFVAPDRTGLS